MLRVTLGERYDPEQRQATEWLEYYTRISVDRLMLRNRLRDSIPSDIGHITLGLAERAEPAEWGPLLLAAAIRPLRTREVAGWTGRTSAAARATLGRMARAGWISPLGRTRTRRYVAGPRLSALPLRSPDISARLRSGEEATGDTSESTSD